VFLCIAMLSYSVYDVGTTQIGGGRGIFQTPSCYILDSFLDATCFLEIDLSHTSISSVRILGKCFISEKTTH